MSFLTFYEVKTYLNAASKGREEEGVVGGDEKSRLEDMGDEELVVLLPLLWKLEPYRSSESRLRSKIFVKLSSET